MGLVGAAGVVLLILGLNLRSSPETPAELPASGSPPVVRYRRLPAGCCRKSPAKATSKSVPKPASSGKTTWRVIAFTYRTRDAAAKRVGQINQRHPHLGHSILFEEKQGFYLIALDGPMTRRGPAPAKKGARRGLPRDVYIHNFAE
jgi:hypothetical protein